METNVINDMFKTRPIIVDNTVERKKCVSFIPQSRADFNRPNGRIEIDIPASDEYYRISDSYLKIKGKLVRAANDNAYDANTQIATINNAMMYLFSNIEYSLGGERIEALHYPGHTTSMLGYLSYPDDFNSSAGLNQCWRKDTGVNAASTEYTASPAVAAGAAVAAGGLTPRRNPDYNEGFSVRRKLLMDNDAPGDFSFNIPFSHIFGFAAHDSVLYSLRHTLKFTRGPDDLPIHRANGVADGKITLTDIRWVIPKITPSVEVRTGLLEEVKNRKESLVSFCARTDDHTIVTQNVRNYEWNINRSTGIEKPRWIIVGFQTDKTRTQEQNPAVFDHINITDAFVQLNSEKYPSEDTSIDFATNDYVDFCDMAEEFKREYYGFNNLIGGTQIDMINYRKLFPLIVFDVRHQSEVIKSNIMNIRLNFKFSVNVPAQTSMYVVILSDRVMKLTSDGQKPMIVNY